MAWTIKVLIYSQQKGPKLSPFSSWEYLFNFVLLWNYLTLDSITDKSQSYDKQNKNGSDIGSFLEFGHENIPWWCVQHHKDSKVPSEMFVSSVSTNVSIKVGWELFSEGSKTQLKSP